MCASTPSAIDEAMTKRSPKVSCAQRSTSCADAVSSSRPACSARDSAPGGLGRRGRGRPCRGFPRRADNAPGAGSSRTGRHRSAQRLRRYVARWAGERPRPRARHAAPVAGLPRARCAPRCCAWRPTGAGPAHPGRPLRQAARHGRRPDLHAARRGRDPLGLLATWARCRSAEAFESSRVARGWAGLADESWRADLVPVVSPRALERPGAVRRPGPGPGEGPVAALTRARLVTRRPRRFWAAVPPVSADLHGSDGLLTAIGIGEAPVGLQGTFSLWRDNARWWRSRAAARRTGRSSPAPRRSAGTPRSCSPGSAVLGSRGTLDGRDPPRDRTDAGSWCGTATQLRRRAEEVLDVYAEAMGVPRAARGSRRAILAAHLDRTGLGAVGARDTAGALVGVAYGHLGEPGQWWHDRVQVALVDALGAREAAAGCAAPSRCASCTCARAWQGTGLGRDLLERAAGAHARADRAAHDAGQRDPRPRLLPRRRLGRPRAAAALPRRPACVRGARPAVAAPPPPVRSYP